MNFGVAFAPLVGMPVLWAAVAAAVILSLLLFVSRSHGAVVRSLALAFIVLALANPSLTREDREPLSSVAVVVVDKSPSQNFGERARQTEAARAAIVGRLSRIPGLDVRVVEAGQSDGETDGTRLFTALGADTCRRAARSRRRRHHDHRRPRPRCAGRRRRARFCRAGSRAYHRQQERARPARGAPCRAALWHCRPVADRDLSSRGSRRQRTHRLGYRSPRRRRRGDAHSPGRNAAARRYPDPARRAKHRRDRSRAACRAN